MGLTLFHAVILEFLTFSLNMRKTQGKGGENLALLENGNNLVVCWIISTHFFNSSDVACLPTHWARARKFGQADKLALRVAGPQTTTLTAWEPHLYRRVCLITFITEESLTRGRVIRCRRKKRKITPVHCTGMNVNPLFKCLTRWTML